MVVTDVLGPFPRSKKDNEYVMVYQDFFTEWMKVAPLKKANSANLKATFEELIIIRWGKPEVLHSDRGIEHANHVLDKIAREYNTHCSFCPVYNAQSNPDERTNRVLKTMIFFFVEPDYREWNVYLKDFIFAYSSV